MAAPRSVVFAQSRRCQSAGARAEDGEKAIARRRQGAATAIRAQPTRRGLGVVSLASRVITDPVVPQDTAARQTRTRPRSIAPVVYESEAPEGDHGDHRTQVQTGRSYMTRIGFIGVGTMGLPMAANLLKKGFALTAYDLNPEAVKAAAAEGGIRFIDAPVSGGTPRATDGTLAIMVGASPEDFQAALPALGAMGANVIHVGPVGSGEVAKLCNNLIAGVAAVAVSEAFRIAEGFGVDSKVITEVIAKSSGNTWLMEHMHPVPGLVARAASTNGYAPGFMTDLMCKHAGLAVDAARALRIPLLVAPAAKQVYRLASSHGLGRKDFTSVYTFLKPSSDQAPV